MSFAERPARRVGEVDRQSDEVAALAVGATDIGEEPEVVHAPDNTAVRGLRERYLRHLADLLQHERERYTKRVQHPAELIREPIGQLRRRLANLPTSS